MEYYMTLIIVLYLTMSPNIERWFFAPLIAGAVMVPLTFLGIGFNAPQEAILAWILTCVAATGFWIVILGFVTWLSKGLHRNKLDS